MAAFALKFLIFRSRLSLVGLYLLSRTSIVSVPEVHPEAEAVMVTVWGPSISVSSIIVRLKVADVRPARMVTEDGTVTLNWASLKES